MLMNYVLIAILVFSKDLPPSHGISKSRLSSMTSFISVVRDEDQITGSSSSSEETEISEAEGSSENEDIEDLQTGFQELDVVFDDDDMIDGGYIFEELEAELDHYDLHQEDVSEFFIEDIAADDATDDYFIIEDNLEYEPVRTPRAFQHEKIAPSSIIIWNEETVPDSDEYENKAPDVSNQRIGIDSYSAVDQDNYFQQETYQKHDKQSCYPVEKPTYENKCSSFTEKTCFTNNVQQCEKVSRDNCGVLIKPAVKTKCLKVKDKICTLKSDEDPKCPTVSRTVCNTIHQVKVNETKSEKCVEVKQLKTEQIDEVVDDVTCIFSMDFSCTEQYSQTTCKQTPTENCRKIPRKISITNYTTEAGTECRKLTVSDEHAEPVPVCRQIHVTSCPGKEKNKENCVIKEREICLNQRSESLEVQCRPVKINECTLQPSHQCIQDEKEKCDMVKMNKMEMVCQDRDQSKISYL